MQQWIFDISQGLSAKAYHAGLTGNQRTEIQTAWMDGEVAVIVATVSFGMGVDKPNVRYSTLNCCPPQTKGRYFNFTTFLIHCRGHCSYSAC